MAFTNPSTSELVGKTRVPQLNGADNFRAWSHGVKLLLGSVKAVHHLNYTVATPIFATAPTPAAPNPDNPPVPIQPGAALLQLVPEDQRNVPGSVLYTRYTAGAPRDILPLLVTAAVAHVHGGTLTLYYNSTDKFEKGFEKYFTDSQLALNVLNSTLSASDQQAVIHIQSAKELYLHLKNKYRVRDIDLAVDLYDQLQTLQFNHDLHSFISHVRDLSARYQDADGNTSDPILLKKLMSKIPDVRYGSDKRNFTGTTLHQFTTHFGEIAQQETPSSEPPILDATVRLNAMRSQAKKGRSLPRKPYQGPRHCNKCFGVGHLSAQCANKVAVCFECGSDKHLSKACPNKRRNEARIYSLLINGDDIYGSECLEENVSASGDVIDADEDEFAAAWKEEMERFNISALRTPNILSSLATEVDELCDVVDDNTVCYDAFFLSHLNSMQPVFADDEFLVQEVATETAAVATNVERGDGVLTSNQDVPMLWGWSSLLSCFDCFRDKEFVSIFSQRTQNSSDRCHCRFGSDCLLALVDSGAGRSNTGNSSILKNIHKIPSIPVTSAFNHTVKLDRAGKLEVMLTNNIGLTVEETLVCEKVDGLILSTRDLAKAGYRVHQNCVERIDILNKNNHLVASAPWESAHGGYILHCTANYTEKQILSKIHVKDHAAPVKAMQRDVQHFRFGHVNKNLLKNIGLNVADCVCMVCTAVKLARKPLGNSVDPETTSQYVPTKVLEKISFDTVGPYPVGAYGTGFTLYLIAVDWISSFVYVHPVLHKPEAGKYAKQFLKLMSSVYTHKPKCVFIDGGSEFVELIDYAHEEGMKIEDSASHVHSQNGKVERQVRSVKEGSRALLAASGMLTDAYRKFWFYAVRHITDIYNVLPRVSGEPSPYEMVYQKKPDLSKFVVFGAPGHAKRETKLKLNTHRRVRYLGVNATGYNCVDIDTQRVINARDAKFYEELVVIQNTTTTPSNTDNILPLQETPRYYFPVQISTSPPDDDMQDADSTTRAIAPETSPPTNEPSIVPAAVPISVSPPAVPLISPPVDNAASTDLIHHATNEANTDIHETQASTPPRHEISEANILSGPRTRQQRALNNYACTEAYAGKVERAVTATPPRSYLSIMERRDAEQWLIAYRLEISNLERVGEMMSVPLPLFPIHIIKIRELFSTKIDPITGKFVYKVRIVARGDLEPAHDDVAVYSPVAGMTALRLFTFLATNFSSSIAQLDVSAAFLYGRLERDIYIALPKGHPDAAKGHVWKTRCALYGLVEAPKLWNNTIHTFLVNFGLFALRSEKCLYVKHSPTGEIVLLVLLYVDDILFVGSSEEMKIFSETISKRFTIKLSTTANTFLNINITRQQQGRDALPTYYLSQTKYTEGLAKRFIVTETKSIHTPMVGKISSPSDDAPIEDTRLYQEYVGALLYVMTTVRPDIAQAVHALTQRTVKPTTHALAQARRVIMYLRTYPHLGLKYCNTDHSHYNIDAYVDASYADQEPGKKSSYGYAVYVNHNIVSYRAKTLSKNVTSSTAAEYLAATEAVKEVLFLRNMLIELQLNPSRKPVVFIDNQPTLRVIRNEGNSDCIRYLDIDLQFTKSQTDLIEFCYVNTECNIADIFTKALLKARFHQLRESLVYTVPQE